MIQTTNSNRRAFALTGLVALAGTLGVSGIAGAQTTHHGVLHRHRHLASGVAGIAAYKAAKHTGKNRTAAGGHRNFAQRHPFVTGAAAAVGTNHLLKRRK